MRLVKLVFISLFFLSLLITAISALFPSTVIVSRAIELNTTPDKISFYTADLNNWNAWMSDWKESKVLVVNNKASVGSQTIELLSKNDSSVRYNWVATGQAPYLVQFEWIRLKDDAYVIHWTFEQHVSWYPWEKFQTLLNEKVLGSKMEIELANLSNTILAETVK
ncbi:MAG: hypothetical protein RL064_1212 [Bacteroidota bacterium]|jgi:hypothetical protein